jgi:phosphohistidine phosphatase
MKLIVMRHGEAGRHQCDSLRALTGRGQVESEKVARAMAVDRWLPRTIWCSSLVRARQTAAIAAACFNLDVLEQPFLKPEDAPEAVIDALQRFDGETPILLVSHMPLVGALAGLLIEGRVTSIPLGTSQAICLEMDIAAAGCALLRKQFCADS